MKSPELKDYYNGMKTTELAAKYGVCFTTMSKSIHRERQTLGLELYSEQMFVDAKKDKDIIMELARSGITNESIVEKYDLSRTRGLKLIKKWKQEDAAKKHSGRTMSAYEFKLQNAWEDLEEDVVITIKGIPRYKISPI